MPQALDFVADMIPVGTKNGFSRFGPGIYTSACSSSKSLTLSSVSSERVTNCIPEADDYFKNVASSKAQSRALLVNAVVYGNPRKLFHTEPSAGSSLRSGYHSVSTTELYDSARFRLTVVGCMRVGDGNPRTRSQLR